MEPESEPERNIHLYHCDHRGLPLAQINCEGNAVWRAEYDEWSNQQMEDNQENLQLLIRLPGQQYDQETGLCYNRYRYCDAMRCDSATVYNSGSDWVEGEWNLYQYTNNPIIKIGPLGLYNLYQLIYDVWHDDSYGTSSIDITGSGDLITLGRHGGVGIAFAKKMGKYYLIFVSMQLHVDMQTQVVGLMRVSHIQNPNHFPHLESVMLQA